MTKRNEKMIQMYTTMYRIRQFETKLQTFFADGKIPGFVHLYLGEEAVAAGTCAALRKDDYITSTHRGHGHLIAELFQYNPFAGLPFAFDELHNTHLHAVAQGSENHAKSGGGLALALASVDDHQPFFDGLGGDDFVPRRFFLFHLFGVAGVQFLFAHIGESFGFFGHIRLLSSR